MVPVNEELLTRAVPVNNLFQNILTRFPFKAADNNNNNNNIFPFL